jgi:tetratricopeptide (TPR) repeat protein
MLNKSNLLPQRQKLIVYIVLTVVTLAVFWQVYQYDFINFDDHAYVTENSRIRSELSLDGIRWIFGTKHLDLWTPLVWLSFMLDYRIYGLDAGGYHLTNLILHILSTLLLFSLFNRMTGAIWKSAFVAACFALHPLHVESVAWISERKDVLSAFFWILTLCLYVYYTEKPAIKRYLLVLFSFVCALMSKPMVVTLPVIMILLDYWPLGRFASKKSNLIAWQLKEKLPFFILAASLSFITLYAPGNQSPNLFPFSTRIANAPVAFFTYLAKTFWPQNMSVYYPFPDDIQLSQVFLATFLIIIITAAVILMAKRLPYLFVGWFWFVITIAPVIGIIQISTAAPYAMADRYHYLPSIGISLILAWGMSSLIRRKKILFPAAIGILAIMGWLSWKQCGYWQNSATLFNHALQVTKDNYLAYEGRGIAHGEMGEYQPAIEDFNKAIGLKKDYADAYNNRGFAYYNLGQYQRAIEDYNEAIRLKPDKAEVYNNRGINYFAIGRYRPAIEDLNKAIGLKKDYADAYCNRGRIYFMQGDKILGCADAQKACKSGNCNLLEKSKSTGDCR